MIFNAHQDLQRSSFIWLSQARNTPVSALKSRADASEQEIGSYSCILFLDITMALFLSTNYATQHAGVKPSIQCAMDRTQ